MTRGATQSFLTAAAIAAGLAAAFAIGGFISGIKPGLPEGYEDEDLLVSAERMRGFTMGLEGLIADWYWMRSLQYLGDKVIKGKEDVAIDDLRDLNPRLLYPLLDSATSMDPHFLAAYYFGAVVLPAIDPGQAVKIAEKGIANNPREWRLYQHLGFIYWKTGDYATAAEIYDKGASLEGTPPFMKMMAARMRTEGGSRETARRIYAEMAESSEDPRIREMASLRLLEIDSMFEREALQQVADSAKAQGADCSSSRFWKEVSAKARGLRTSEGKALRFDASSGVPVDPAGVPYLTDGACRVVIDSKNSPIPAR